MAGEALLGRSSGENKQQQPGNAPAPNSIQQYLLFPHSVVTEISQRILLTKFMGNVLDVRFLNKVFFISTRNNEKDKQML